MVCASQAEDADKTSNVTYSIVADDETKALFGIGRTSGEIEILSETGLARNNESDTFTFTVTVSARFGIGALSRVAREVTNLVYSSQANDGKFSSECVVNVQVLDVNNNAPEFVLDEYSIEILEDVDIGKTTSRFSSHRSNRNAI